MQIKNRQGRTKTEKGMVELWGKRSGNVLMKAKKKIR